MLNHEESMSPRALRRTGIDHIGDLPWGAHVCLFYETAQDLLEVHARYFAAGLADNEFCIWALSHPLSRKAATKRLREMIPDFDDYLREGRIELVPGYDWYLNGETFDPQRVTRGWYNKLDRALARGFAGLRVSGNAFWCETSMWNAFCEYEADLHRTLAGRKMIVLCTYALQASRAADMLDVARTHHVSLAIRNGQWELVEIPEMAEADCATARLNGRTNVVSTSFRGVGRLTRREEIVLGQLIQGASSKEAGRTLSISPRTVDFHRANIMRKLGARNTVDLLGIVLGMR